MNDTSDTIANSNQETENTMNQPELDVQAVGETTITAPPVEDSVS